MSVWHIAVSFDVESEDDPREAIEDAIGHAIAALVRVETIDSMDLLDVDADPEDLPVQ